jgi:anti-sigma regulatory factor (Ser/Thr protein kinase)
VKARCGSCRTEAKGRGALELKTALRDEPGEVQRARQLVSAGLTHWGLADEDGIAILLVSELVTNALRYGRPPLSMVARRGQRTLRVEVHDGAPDGRPRLRPLDPETPGGLGLLLVEALATRWGWSEADGGKYVWFELDLRA